MSAIGEYLYYGSLKGALFGIPTGVLFEKRLLLHLNTTYSHISSHAFSHRLQAFCPTPSTLRV